MERSKIELLKVRCISVGFTVLALAVFKPFGLGAWQWQAYAHLLSLWILGVAVCLLTEAILKFVVNLPQSSERGVDYIIRRNLWFQCINTPMVSLMICLYRHYVLSSLVAGNRLSMSNYFETLLIIAFCSFAIGLYWRFKYRSRFLAAELQEMQLLNDRLRRMHATAEQASDSKQAETAEQQASDGDSRAVITLTGTTSETIDLRPADLLYVESVGNYVKVYHVRDEQVSCDVIRATMKQIESDLRAYRAIIRTHRAFIVNLEQVERVDAASGSMQLLIKHCHDAVPVSRSNVATIKQAIKAATPK